MSEYLRREETRRDIEAALAARRELGPEYHDSIAAGLAERVEQLAAIRTAELRHEAQIQEREANEEKSTRGQRLALAIVSLGTGVPITAIAATQVEPALLGVLVAWAGIVGVNVAAGLRRKDR
ncbi:MAG TPA: hypothetical protein VLJ88_13470 [Propionibacteriaceae bacterium]|nr:hypothetical protein [Propionibacteriaceae bacterium]